jgi:lysophospholipase L1-like esterase
LNKWVLPLVQEIAKEENLLLIDVHQFMKKGFKFTLDGIHLNEKGYKLLAKEIGKKIN